MAVNQQQIEAACNFWWDKTAGVQDNWSCVSPMLRALMGRFDLKRGVIQPGDMVAGGKFVREFFEYGPGPGGPFGPKSEFNTSNIDTFNGADFVKGGANASCTIGLDEKIANATDDAYVKLHVQKLDNARKTIQHVMAHLVYLCRASAQTFTIANWPGQDTDLGAPFDGLQALFGINWDYAFPQTAEATSLKYGEIDEASVPVWKPNYTTAASAGATVEISDALLMTMQGEANPSGDPDEELDYFFMDRVLVNSMRSQVFNLMRLPPPDSSYMAKVGFKSIIWNGIPLVYDPYIAKALYSSVCTVAQAKTYLFGINTKHIRLRSFKDYAFKLMPWEHKAQSGGNNETAGIIYQGVISCNNRTGAGSCYNNVIAAQ